MKAYKLFPISFCCWLLVTKAYTQGLFEHFPIRPEAFTAALLAYRGNMDVRGFGSASLFFAPTTTNDMPGVVCVVTAKHNLTDKTTHIPFDGLLVKINMPSTSHARYINIPLKHDDPKNYWCSPSGLDLVAIPLPPDVVNGADVGTFFERQIFTPTYMASNHISTGLVVLSLCLQPEVMESIDFAMPQVFPTLRIGHLSRLGFSVLPSGVPFVRSHVIDLHASPGNSGATVIMMVPKDDQSVSQPTFLGIVQGFPEESSSYIPYEAPITNSVREVPTLCLVNTSRSETNQIALSFKTIANPNLTYIIPVHELVGLWHSESFMKAILVMLANRPRYTLLNEKGH